ncbi:MAG TPA: nitrous oxide reductase accessory protein NosL [Chitinophagaceae bacterium]|nr:nitrous oxide reductase accessory protein NosL [Chitinophagaceae bacterium]
MKNKIGIVSRILLVICALALAAVLFVPLWRIDLVAPQYPEGLYLLIHPNKLSGNVDIINGLNHYIGMKTLHTEDFTEFIILPYLIVFYALLFLAAAIVGKRKFLNLVFILFLVFGIVAMADFWKWEYDYGHDLNPDAAIKVPGMSYQPPLIGYKQLLNFSAYSMPDIGGWIFVGVGLLGLTCVALVWKANKKGKLQHQPAIAIVAGLLLFTLASCNTSPEPIKVGSDNCSFCKMTISDARYGAEIITKKGKIYKFDDSHCVLAYLKNAMEKKDVADVYFTDFNGKHELINAKTALFFESEELKTPMGGNVAVFSSKDSLQKLSQQYKGSEISWDELSK